MMCLILLLLIYIFSHTKKIPKGCHWVENSHPLAVSFGHNYAIGPIGVLTIAAIYPILGRSVLQWSW